MDWPSAIGLRIADDWPLADNHIYLLAYWCLAIALALRSLDAVRTLALTSRWLVGLAFVFAVIWKAFLSPDFLDGRFFRVTLLTDPRFGEAAMLIGGLSAAASSRADRAGVHLAPARRRATRLRRPSSNHHGSAIARCRRGEFCPSKRGRHPDAAVADAPVSALKHAALLMFCGVTYAFAPVAGFGWLLLVMGLAQTTERAGLASALLRGGFLVVLFYSEVPWASLLLTFSR